jgi:hypothetical protein
VSRALLKVRERKIAKRFGVLDLNLTGEGQGARRAAEGHC